MPPDVGLGLRLVRASGPFAGQAVAAGFAAGRRIERAEAANQPAGYGALGNLVGGRPFAPVSHAGQRKAVVARPLAVTQHAVELAVILGHFPRPVVVEQLQAIEQIAAAHFRRAGEQAAHIAMTAQSHLRQRRLHPAEIVDMRRPGRREIAFLGEIRPLAEADAVDQLGDQEIEIGVALAVGMGRHIDRHAADISGEIGAVVEVEAAQEILVRLAVAGVLGDDQAGHHFQRFAGAQDGHGEQALAGDHAFAAGRGDAFQIFSPGPHLDRRKFGRFVCPDAGHRGQKIGTK